MRYSNICLALMSMYCPCVIFLVFTANLLTHRSRVFQVRSLDSLKWALELVDKVLQWLNEKRKKKKEWRGTVSFLRLRRRRWYCICILLHWYSKSQVESIIIVREQNRVSNILPNQCGFNALLKVKIPAVFGLWWLRHF